MDTHKPVSPVLQPTQSREVFIGKTPMGGSNPVRIQSMTNTDTMDTKASVRQVLLLSDAGCDYVRLTTQGVREAENLARIKEDLQKKGCYVPLIADVHFNPKAAEIAATIVEKVRINPGNYTDKKRLNYQYSEQDFHESRDQIAKNLLPLLEICKKHHTAIRIGTNHGSLSDRILARYGNTPAGMVESAIEFIEICREADFHNLVLSMKSSHVPTMIEANQLLVKRMTDMGYYYPVHLGVTEAGDGEDGRIKSAAGIGNLLANGIGDTIRVSLTENPEYEVPVAKNLVQLYGDKSVATKQVRHQLVRFESQNRDNKKHPLVISTEETPLSDVVIKSGVITVANEKMLSGYQVVYDEPDYESLVLKAATDISLLMLNHRLDGIWIVNHGHTTETQLAQLSLNILQGLGMRYSKTEFIACPSCGRTLFNLMDQLALVRSKTQHLAGLKIAVMGCAVNGPGEMADANYGYVGAGRGKVSLYVGKNVVAKNVPETEAVENLIAIIKEAGDWTEPAFNLKA